MKKCTTCKQMLPLSKFGHSKNRKDGLSYYCLNCVSIKEKIRRQYKKLHKICEKCSQPAVTLHCDKHRLTSLARAKRREIRLETTGLCRSCGQQGVAKPGECPKCTMISILNDNICRAMERGHPAWDRSTRKQFRLTMIERFYQHPVCPYTNTPLIPGVNLHLDHKIAVSIDLSMALDCRNLQWVSDVYNRAKGLMTDEQFAEQYVITYRKDLK